MEIRAAGRAKVNLHLKVGEVRPDGFHEVTTVMQTIDLADEVRITPADTTSVGITWAEGLSGPLPEPPDLVERTIDLLVERLGEEMPAVSARVTKRIPIAAGLGGGSADAAAAILAINELIGKTLSSETMMGLAASIGSDVAFALQGGSGLATGRGEQVSAVPVAPILWWVVAIPDARLSAAQVYRRYDEIGPGSSPAPHVLLRALRHDEVVEAGRHLHNDLEPAAFDLLPELPGLKDKVTGAGPLGAVVSGSGPAIAALCRDREHAKSVARAVNGAFARVEIAPCTARGAEVLSGRG